jgi:hypothetical protein
LDAFVEGCAGNRSGLPMRPTLGVGSRGTQADERRALTDLPLDRTFLKP